MKRFGKWETLLGKDSEKLESKKGQAKLRREKKKNEENAKLSLTLVGDRLTRNGQLLFAMLKAHIREILFFSKSYF